MKTHINSKPHRKGAKAQRCAKESESRNRGKNGGKKAEKAIT
jgi:hypothetical protein